MAYFDQVTPPVSHQNHLIAIDKFTRINQMIERVEKQAIDIVNEKYPYMRDMTQIVIIDPYVNHSPEDHLCWLELLQRAERQDRELYARLFYIRGCGTKLIPNDKWGFVFQPVIGVNGWDSIDQYNQEKTCLNGYSQQVIDLLGTIQKTG